MNVSLTPELEEFVRERVDSGRYRSASEVVRSALRLLQDRERLRAVKLEELRAAVQKGLDSGPAGELDIDAIKEEARECWESEQKKKQGA
jgi:antitoxin ParD1/3/4